jgi:uncharacterized protein YihD (DUF1040 family)
MRDPNRISQIINTLKIYWEKHPDQRLGQILSNVNNVTEDRIDDIFYMEDDQIIKGLDMLSICFELSKDQTKDIQNNYKGECE